MIFIGCAGWSIASARAGSFPGGGSHLERYARIFNAVEINSSFYRPHQPRTYARWAESVPEDFRFAVKMPKAISHVKRLRDCGTEVQAFLDQASCLGAKLGVLLLQLPPGLAFDPGIVLPFLDDLRKRHHGAIACEPRHVSWFKANVDAALRERGIARTAADQHAFRALPRRQVTDGSNTCACTVRLACITTPIQMKRWCVWRVV